MVAKLKQNGMVRHWRLQKPLGRGKFGDVWQAVHVKTKALAAIKVIPLQEDPERKAKQRREVDILSRLQHENIVACTDHIVEENRIVVMMELCTFDLRTYKTKKTGRRYGYLAEEETRHLMRQLASGLQYLHEKNITHRDLKLANLLLVAGYNQRCLKIADFGLATTLADPAVLLESLVGTPVYMAPDLLYGNYKANADLWSVGIILYELLSGRLPPNFRSAETALRAMHKREFGCLLLPASRRAEVSLEVQSLLEGLLQPDAAQRITFADFFAHPWLQEGQQLTYAAPPSPCPLHHDNREKKEREDQVPPKQLRHGSIDEELTEQFQLISGALCEATQDGAEEVRMRLRVCLAVGAVAVHQASSHRYGNALALLAKALAGMEATYRVADAIIYHYRWSGSNALLAALRNARSLVRDEYLSCHNRFLELSTRHCGALPGSPVSELLLAAALAAGKEGAVQEAQGNTVLANQLYVTGVCLLDQLCNDSCDADRSKLLAASNAFADRAACTKPQCK